MQAERDLEMAEIARGAGRHEWACFATQQGAEKAVKARYLDSLCIPTRYPDAFPEGPSAEHYGPLQSQETLDYAREILAFARAQMA